MKKLFSLFAAAVMAVSMMAEDATIFLDPSTQAAVSSSADINLTINGVTISYNGTLNMPTEYVPNADFRVFAGKSLTLSASSNITKVRIIGLAKAGFTGSTNKGTITAGGSYAEETTKATWEDPLIVIEGINATSVTLDCGKQIRVYMIEVTLGEGGDTPPTPPTPSGDVTITGLNYADAIFYADETYGDYWAFDFYKELDEEGYILSPYVYFVCEESTTSGTKIAGTWTAYDAGYFATDDEESGIYTDEEVPVGSLTVTCVSQGVYNFVGSFVGTDGKTYTWTLNNMEVYAYNGDTYEDITLTDGGTPTPPTPVGDEITPEQALEIGKALADNATTSETYRVVGIVSYANSYNTQYGSQTFSMSSDGADSKSNFKAYQCYVDAPGVQVGNKVAVTGKILKYVDKNGTTIEIKQGTVEILDGPVPPTPVGTEINVAKAEEIAAALGNNEQTAETYTVIGYAVKAYDPSSGTQDIWMSDTKGAKGNFMAKKTTSTDGTIYDDEYIAVTGKIEKNFYNDKTTLQIYKGTAKHLSETALLKIMQNVKVKKMLMDGQVIILKGTQLFDLSGRLIE